MRKFPDHRDPPESGNTAAARSDERHRRRRWLIVFFSVGAYVVVFMALFPSFGPGLGPLATLPVVLAAWFWGLRAGLLAGVLCLPLNTILYNIVGLPGWDAVFQSGGGFGTMALLAVGGVVGQLSDMRRRLRQEITEREQVEAALQEAKEELELKVAERTEALARVNEQLQHELDRLRQAEGEISRQAGRAEALLAVAAQLNAQLDLPGVLHAVCEAAARALNVPVANVSLYDEQRDVLYPVGGRGLPEELRQQAPPVPRALFDEAFRQMGPVVVVPDLQQVSGLPGYELFTPQNIRSLALARLEREGELIGSLNVMTLGEARAFTPDELELLQGLADLAAQAIANARLFDEAGRRLRRTQALRSIDLAITASLDLGVTLNVLLDQVTAQLGVDAAEVLLLNAHTLTLEYAAGRGFRTQALARTPRRLGESHAGRAAQERRIVHIPNLPEVGEAFARAPLVAEEGFIAYYAVPLVSKGHLEGVLEIFHRAPLAPDPEWMEFLETLAGQAAIAIENVSLFNDLQRSTSDLILAYDTTLEGWTRALDLRDRETEGHTRRVTEMAVRLAQAMGVSDTELVHVRRGALLHDIGKMGIPDAILLKPGPLTDEEWAVMRRHPEYAYNMLAPITYLRPALDIPYCHHEKWDGTGYPRGLKGKQIPLAARIFAVADVWDALRSDRPYRPAWPEDKVREHIRSLAGTHLDPQAVETFLRTTPD
jgi:HD-GYP domain-containing protein (c-di-GMP phosphodiesterase class II)